MWCVYAIVCIELYSFVNNLPVVVPSLMITSIVAFIDSGLLRTSTCSTDPTLSLTLQPASLNFTVAAN